jgi:polyisoprenoid-binding protein YceI
MAAAAMMLPGGAFAAPVTLALSPANMLAQTHSRGMFLPVTGTFRQLSGTLTYDQAAGTCAVDVTFVVASLELPNALVRSQTMSAGFLDPVDYPTQHYVGSCRGAEVVGQLTMRGQTHEFDMAVRSVPGGLHLEGVLNRYDWGIDGHAMTVGKMIRVTNDIALDGGAIP